MMRTLFVGQSCAEAESVPSRMASAANTLRRIALPPLSSWPRPDVSWCGKQAKGRATVGAATKLRNLFASGHIAVAPGAYDGLSARLVALAGFPAVYASGGAIARSAGVPDLGLIPVDAIVERLPAVGGVVDISIIADPDPGYGNALNAQAAARAFERAGVAAFHLEDQTFPKKCGHYDDKSLVPV